MVNVNPDKNGCYPNGIVITVEKEKIVGKETPYLLVKRESVSNAAQTLSGVAFKIWIYYMGDNDGYTEAYSPAKLAKNLGISEHSAKAAKEELIEAGYLKPTQVKKNEYFFVENPKTTAREKIAEKKGRAKQKQVREPQAAENTKPPMVRKNGQADTVLMPDGKYYTSMEWAITKGTQPYTQNEWLDAYQRAKAAMGIAN